MPEQWFELQHHDGDAWAQDAEQHTEAEARAMASDWRARGFRVRILAVSVVETDGAE